MFICINWLCHVIVKESDLSPGEQKVHMKVPVMSVLRASSVARVINCSFFVIT